MKRKIYWHKTKGGDLIGYNYPIFLLYKCRRKWFLRISERPQDENGNPKPREIKCDSLHQAKIMANKFLKELLK